MKKLLFVITIGVAVLNSCSKKIGPTPETLKGILLGKDTLTMYVGDTRQLPYTLTPSDISTKTLIFKSSDSTIISISNSGLLTARKTGFSVVSVTNQDKTVSVAALVSVLVKRTIDSLKVGLIAYYPFNYDSAVDSSGNGNDGTIYDITSVSDRFGKPNSAFYFNGSSSYINVKDNAALRLSNTDFTLNSWINMPDYSASYGSLILSKRGVGSSNGWIYGVGGYGNLTNSVGIAGTVTYNVSGGPDPYVAGKIAVGLNQWHMVTVIYSLQKHQASIYVDGVLDTVATNMPSPNPLTVTDLFIGADSQGSFNPSASAYFVKGKLDDIRIYGRALNTTEISKLYHLTH
jgi:hypothetical protein